MVKKILVLDSDSEMRDTIKTLLKRKNYEVITAIDRATCLKKLKKHKPDLILLDVGVVNAEVTNLLRKMRGIGIVVLVDEDLTKEKEEQLYDLHVVDIIQKPFDIDLFYEKIKELTQ